MLAAPLSSMTGFARTEGLAGDTSWHWELRSVNARGLELRMRLPPGLDALEPGLRESAGRVLRRGTVQASLTLRRDAAAVPAADPAVLDQVLRLALDLAARIPGAPPPRAEALLALPGVLRPVAVSPEAALADPRRLDALRQGFEQALHGLVDGRRAEGARLAAVLGAQIDAIAALHDRASSLAAGQGAAQRTRLLDSLHDLLRGTPPDLARDDPASGTMPAPGRIAQEVALLAVRSDVREELDRLASHVAAARALLAEGAGVGRRLDFLVQEFAREANTLCAKSAHIPLTAVGLDLKAAIEQLREQVQNIE
jgi:uncharacterized protein (TIGR00255 family)